MRNPCGSRQRLAATLLPFLTLSIVIVSAVVVLAGCGAYNPTHVPTPTPATSYVYFYSRVDYPLELQVNGAADTVTLQLSFEKNILLVTPSPGSGVSEISPVPFSLPTDLTPYQDISAQAAATSDGKDSPVLWQLVSPPLQSLLLPPTPGAPREYVSSVSFRWRVSAIHAGANVVKLSLAITYTLHSGDQQQGQIEVSSDPIAIRAVDATPVTILPNGRIELVGLVSLVGVGSILGFLWNVYSVIEKVIGALATIRNLFRRLFRRRRLKRRRTRSSAPSSRSIPPAMPPLTPSAVSQQRGPQNDRLRDDW